MDDDYKNTSVSDVSHEASYPKSGSLMKCPHCTADIEVGSMYCEYCGGRIEDSQSPSVAHANVSHGATPGYTTEAPLATKSLVFSIIGLAVLFLVLLIAAEVDDDFDMLVGLVGMGGIAASIVGMVLGISGLKRINGNRSAYSGVSKLTVGKVLGIVGVAIWGAVMFLGTIVILAEEGLEGLM